ncbi:hypothetical protein [Streptomyces sp. MST-110588]|uniref:hypothetical protein n=1 Tax=Streptomyces sp. MST-110588 TaxID=2833628 RepID=UPI001F5D3425|nr:hypothetical protein [Streptomyces sp. MST-110588]UNO41725.1 hypothetical protein KGS77_21955 [Streptomyces sp. MST-110588]
MAISPGPKALAITGVAAALACAGLTTLSVAQAAPQPTPAVAGTAASGDMPPVVEDFTYPGAAKLLQEREITLKRGDGHIMLSDCNARHDIKVESRTGDNFFCFTVSGNDGYLTMELPDAYAMWTKGHPVQAKIVAEATGKTTVVKAPKTPEYKYTTMGETGDTHKRSVLVELRVNG